MGSIDISSERLAAADGLPQHLTETYSNKPKLTREQCGHIRHFHNLASLPDGDWSLMGSLDSLQEHDMSYRYQLAAMTYGIAAAHYHRMPIMRSLLKPLIRKLIAKMLRREVWGYWYTTSQSGIGADPDLKELRKPWADPVCRENIMYSGHLLLMTSLYGMLFNDDTFEEPDSIVFDWDPIFFGLGPESFKYDRAKLQATILKEMEHEGWMGACCEPNMVFIVCNQFPLIAMRYNDIRHGTHVIDEVLPKYKAAWAKRGMVAENGLYRQHYAPRRDITIDAGEVGHSFWISAFLSSWNTDLVQKMYPSISLGFLHKIDNRINIRPAPVANAVRSLVRQTGKDPNSPSVDKQAREVAWGKPHTTRKYMGPVLGHIAQGMSEAAGSPDLDALLRHADTYLRPTWLNGGLYYPRCDQYWDDDGNYTYGDPYTGNAAIGYGRLNVQGGQKQMWEHPWTREEVDRRPWIDGVGFGMDVDCLMGDWNEEKKALEMVLRTWNGEVVDISPVVRNLPKGDYGVYVNGDLKNVAEVANAGDDATAQLVVGGEEVRLTVLQSSR